MKRLTATLIIAVAIFAALNATSHNESFNIADLSISSNELGFHEVSLSDCGQAGIVGNPDLPSKVVSFIIPKSSDASNLSVSVSSINLDEAYNVMPLQTPEYYNGDSSDFTEPNSAVYSCDKFYPDDYAEIISQGYVDGANRIVSIRLNPVRYNPVSQVVEFVNDLYLSFSLGSSNSHPIYPAKRFSIDAPKYEAYLYNLVENTDDIVNYRYVPDIVEDSVIDPNYFSYLIICPDDIATDAGSPFAEFIQWKEQKGHSVRIMTYSQIANHVNAGNGDDIGEVLINDTPGKIRKFLQYNWQHHGLANVLLVGGMDDEEIIRYAHDMSYLVGGTIPDGNKYPSDVYFADFQGSWNNDGDDYYGEFGNPIYGEEVGDPDNVEFFQDIFIGRLILPPTVNPPAGSPSRHEAVLNWVEKVLTYEKGPGSGFDGYLDKCYSLSASCIDSSASSVLASHGFDRLLVSDSFIDGDLRPLGNDVIAGINSYLPGIIVLSGHGNKGRVRVADAGPNIRNYITSLNRYNIDSYLVGNETMNGLDNLINPLKKYPILLANSCNTAQYDYNITLYNNEESLNPSMAEAFTSFTAGIGGPLWVGNTRSVSSGSCLESQFVTNLFDGSVLNHYPDANPWCGGVSFASARVSDGGNISDTHARTYVGDPDMEIWTARPLKLNMTLNYAAGSVIVKDELGSVVENARVVFSNTTEKHIVYTNSNGVAGTNLNFSRVAAHKQNYVHDAIRVIRGQETIASTAGQTMKIDERVYVPTNATLTLSGSLMLTGKSRIESYGDLVVSSNSEIFGSKSSSVEECIDGNRITVYGSATIGQNVKFAATNQLGWDGVSINNGVVFLQDVDFTNTPLELTNCMAVFDDSCHVAKSPIKVENGVIDAGSNSNFVQSPISTANSTASFNTCFFDRSNVTHHASEATYLNCSPKSSEIKTQNTNLVINGGMYLNSKINVIHGQLSIQSSNMSSTGNSGNNASVVTSNASVSIDSSAFERCPVNTTCVGLTHSNMATTISNSTFTTGSGINLCRIPNFDISGNHISQSQRGITVINSGNGSQNWIRDNVIENNSIIGISIIASNVSITGSNQIQNNGSGIGAGNLSSWSLIGVDSSPTGEYQLVQYNNGHQVLISGNDSVPDYLTYNCIQNYHHNTPWIRVFNYSGMNLIDVRYNYWGDDFQPDIDLNPSNAFIYNPIWTPGDIPAIEESAAGAFFRDAYYHELNGEYEEAIDGYKLVIELFPDTEYAALAAKALLRIEDAKKDLEDPNLDYAQLKTYYESESNLSLNQEIDFIRSNLIAQVDLRTENYIDAINFYESVISNPPSTADSLYAIINLGNAYLLMEASSKGQTYVGKYANLKPADFDDWMSNTERILDQIHLMCTYEEHNVPGKVITINNYPNPFNPSTTITYSIPEDGLVKIDIYNIKGQKVKQLCNTEMRRGHHKVIWDGKDRNQRNVSSGVYFVRLQANGQTAARKIMLMK